MLLSRRWKRYFLWRSRPHRHWPFRRRPTIKWVICESISRRRWSGKLPTKSVRPADLRPTAYRDLADDCADRCGHELLDCRSSGCSWKSYPVGVKSNHQRKGWVQTWNTMSSLKRRSLRESWSLFCQMMNTKSFRHSSSKTRKPGIWS